MICSSSCKKIDREFDEFWTMFPDLRGHLVRHAALLELRVEGLDVLGGALLLLPVRQRASRDVRERRLAKFRQNVARFRLYRLRFLQENMRFAVFFKFYQIRKLKFLKFDKILQISRHLQFFLLHFHENCCFFKATFLRKF